MSMARALVGWILFLVCATIAGCGGDNGSPSTATSPPVLGSIQITPASVSRPAGVTQQLQAIGTYSDGHTADLTKTVTWSSSATTVATVDDGGVVATKTVGTTTIRATSGAVTSNTATLAVTAAQLLSIQVTPPTASIAAGRTQQYAAVGTYTDASTVDITASVTWSSGSPNIATIAGNGLATGVAPGQARIQAQSGSVLSNTAALTVTNAMITAIQVTPAVAKQPAGVPLQYTAIATFSDGSQQDISAVTTWSSSDPGKATVDAKGLATTRATGAVTITASQGGVQSNAVALTIVDATLVRLDVTPPTASIPVGLTQAYVAVGTFSDGSRQDLSTSVSWASGDTTKATIGVTGLATGVAVGTTSIQATLAGIASNAAALVVTPAALVRIQVTPAAATKVAGTTLQYAAMGFYTDASAHDITASVSWHSSSTALATITTSGLATAVAPGAPAITATLGAVTSNVAVLTVSSATLVSIQVNPTSNSIPAGTTQQYSAVGTYSDGSTQTISTSVAWRSSSTATATIDTTGLATAVSAASTTITATSGAVTSNGATLTVTPAVLASIAVTPTAASVAAGLTQQYMAIGTYTDGSTQNLTTTATWASSNTTVATIAASGLATARAAGSANITATSGAIASNAAALTVTAAQLTSIAVTPTSVTTSVGGSQQYTATGTYTDATTADITANVTWSSSNTSVATISATGLATAVASGSSNIVATMASVTSNTAVLTVGAAAPGNMIHGRYNHAATLLNDGTVLVTGGIDNAGYTTAETYDPTTRTWTATGSMASGHSLHANVKLQDGRILVPGGNSTSTSTAITEIYDPATRTFSTVAPMNVPRQSYTATLLANGRVLVAGGLTTSRGALSSAEIYDPVANTWTVVASMTTGRAYFTAALLQNGKVLVVGLAATSELYDPVANTWTAAANPVQGSRLWYTDTSSVVLANGSVFVSGGGYATSEAYDPAANTWTAMGSMVSSRIANMETLLPSNKVVVSGGQATLEVFNPATGLFETPVPMQSNRAYGTATLLNDGHVLFTGGLQSISGLATCELF